MPPKKRKPATKRAVVKVASTPVVPPIVQGEESIATSPQGSSGEVSIPQVSDRTKSVLRESENADQAVSATYHLSGDETSSLSDLPQDFDVENDTGDDATELKVNVEAIGNEADAQPSTSKRSPRKRAPPVRLAESAEEPVATRAKPAARRKSEKQDEWGVDYLLTNPMSKLVSCDLIGLFADPRSMDCLTKEQKERLALHLPEHLVHESPEDGFKSIPPDFLRYNNDWRHGVRLFQEDLAAGRYDPAWQEEAADAMENRAHGDYDDFKLGKFEAFWGQNQKLAKEATAGGSAKIKLDLLSREDVFRVGDVWSFSRTVTDKKTKVKITVEKEALVCGKSGPEGLLGLLDFTFPPGQHKFSNPNIREDVKVTNISGPQSLETAIFKEDGRVEAAGNGNAWKVFRVLRNNQDLGLIWDMREAFWLKRGEEDEKAERTGIPNRERRKRGQGSQQSFEDEV